MTVIKRTVNQPDQLSLSRQTYWGLRMPEGIMATEGVTVRGRKALHGLALGKTACTARGFGSVPLAAVLRNDVVKEAGEYAGLESLLRGAGVVCGAEMEGGPFPSRDSIQN